MFVENQKKESRDYYQKMLAALGSLSRLFSESTEPYIPYRLAENLFCKAFSADNLSRSDVSVDATKDGTGFAIKTFIHGNGKTIQKIAEFNSEHDLFDSLDPESKIRKIAELRNTRIDTTKAIYDLNDAIYHCVTRKPSEIHISESPLDLVDIDRIVDIKKLDNIISFNDRVNEYSFNIAKSTLYKRFNISDFLLVAPTEILVDPFAELEKLLGGAKKEYSPVHREVRVALPLFSDKGDRHVQEKSGLNQWNAGGRERNVNEAYIPIPKWIHDKFPGFFPPKDEPFNILLPNKKTLNVKVCQDDSKALMSNPNSALGEWLLRDILKLPEGELVTYIKLEEIGLDSVAITKQDGVFKIEFAKTGTYDDFKNENS